MSPCISDHLYIRLKLLSKSSSHLRIIKDEIKEVCIIKDEIKEIIIIFLVRKRPNWPGEGDTGVKGDPCTGLNPHPPTGSQKFYHYDRAAALDEGEYARYI